MEMKHRLSHRTAVVVAAAASLSLAVMVAAASATVSAQKASRVNAVDRAFVREMVPHHQMAVAMAKMATTQGEHAEIRTLAGAIVRDQNREVRVMRKIARRLGVKPETMPMHPDHMTERMMEDFRTLGVRPKQTGMTMNMDDLGGAKPFDRQFIDMMIPHHQGAIRMARAERARGKDAHLRSIARGIIIAQAKEIRQLNSWRKQWYGATSPAGGIPPR
jgi:uncharacterized protein (DUF305 family)